MNTPQPPDPQIDVLIDRMAQVLHFDLSDANPEVQTERMQLARDVYEGVNKVGNQQRFIMYWLLQMMRTGDARVQGLAQLLPYCNAAMTPENTPRVKLAAANLLYEAEKLSESAELQTLQEAENAYHQRPDEVSKDASLKSLVYWAICAFSHNADDVRAVLNDIKNNNRNTQLTLARGAIQNLSWPDICSVVEEQVEHFQDEDADRSVVAQFCLRGIRRLLATTHNMVLETEEGDDKESGDTVRIVTNIESLMEALSEIPEETVKIAGAKYHLASKYRAIGNLDEAMDLIQEAKIACMQQDPPNAKALTDIELLLQNMVEDMEERDPLENGDSDDNE